MGILRSKQIIEATAVPVPDGPEIRFNKASALHQSSLAVIQDFAERLTEAGTRYDNLVVDIDAEISRLATLRMAAASESTKAFEAAESALDITRGFRNDFPGTEH